MTTTGKVYATGVTADTTLTNAAETIAVQVFNVNVPNGGQAVIEATAMVVPGATVTAFVLTVRRGPLITSPIVGEIIAPAGTTAANNPFALNGQVVDQVTAEQANQTYTITVTQTGGSSNGTVTQASAAVNVN